VPYDRPLTTMAPFTMCPSCRDEYENPGDRRFHAQPNACPVCGPAASLMDGAGRCPATAAPPADPVRGAAAALRDGAILAIKGIGGFHLACRADEEAVVSALRAAKHREDKPFALMVAGLPAAEGLALLGPADRILLHSPARPIVLAPRRAEAEIALSVAPSARELGLMLPYSPLHHLLLGDLGEFGVDALVLTSGNVSDEPIAFTDDDALTRLAPIADLFLLHDRPIATRTDDSVVRTVSLGGESRPVMLRRSRGYVPDALPLPGGTPVGLLGGGAELKNTFCVAKGERAWVGHHIGDLRNYETLSSYQAGIGHFCSLFAVTPEVVAHDLHPEYLSTKHAVSLEGVELIAVQHHHAHLAACLAEHHATAPAVGAIFDGTGFGSDGTVWGGEFLFGDLRGFRRVGKLLPARLPGGERAIREPWRMACAWLTLLAGAVTELPVSLRGQVEPRVWEQVSRLTERGFSAPVTTSMGRLFDGVAALCGVRPRVTYEGQAAIEFEARCDDLDRGAYPVGLSDDDEGLVLDPRPTLRAVLGELAVGVSVERIAARFHAALAAGTVEACTRACSAHRTETVVLSGGVFQNRRLLQSVTGGLSAAGLRVLVPQRLPVSDGGISFGQVAIAAARVRQSTP
jgi:hydrogenase maturation protein HypF